MTQCLVVMQPTFLPWAGYFNLIFKATDFVFLNNVQLEKQSWQTRNRLIISGSIQWITLPVQILTLKQTIMETRILDIKSWRNKLSRKFDLNYKLHPYYFDAREVIDYLLEQSTPSLAEYNENIIKYIVLKLQFTTCLHRSNEIPVDGVRSKRLIELCKYFGAEEYLSPIGAFQYLEKDEFQLYSSAKLCFQNYTAQPYPQKNTNVFIPNLSILDIIANLGWELTKKYIQQGFV